MPLGVPTKNVTFEPTAATAGADATVPPRLPNLVETYGSVPGVTVDEVSRSLRSGPVHARYSLPPEKVTPGLLAQLVPAGPNFRQPSRSVRTHTLWSPLTAK